MGRPKKYLTKEEKLAAKKRSALETYHRRKIKEPTYNQDRYIKYKKDKEFEKREKED